MGNHELTKINKKKLITLFVTFVICFFFFLGIYYKPRSYEKEYAVSEYKILEKYYKEEKTYYFKLTKNEQIYEFALPIKYTPNRRLINKVALEGDDLVVTYQKKKTYRIGNNKINDKVLSEYENIKIYDESEKYLIWNYNSIISINKSDKKKVKLFDFDTYENNLMTIIDDYLFLPNYENKYETDEIILINLKSFKKEIVKLDYTLTYDSYILGIYDNDIYMVDKKSNLEYKFNIRKKELKILSDGLIYNNGFKEVDIQTLINEKHEFIFNNIYHYKVEDNKLYLSYLNSDVKTFVTDFEEGIVVKIDNEKIYYVIEDILYSYSPSFGIKKLLQNFEWNFNKDNVIFIY